MPTPTRIVRRSGLGDRSRSRSRSDSGQSSALLTDESATNSISVDTHVKTGVSAQSSTSGASEKKRSTKLLKSMLRRGGDGMVSVQIGSTGQGGWLVDAVP